MAQVGDGIAIAGEHQPIRGTAAGTEQAGAVDIVAIDQQRRRHLQQLAGRVGFGQQHCGNAHAAVAELDLVAHLHAERVEQARIGVGLARRRCAGRLALQAGRIVADQQLPA